MGYWVPSGVGGVLSTDLSSSGWDQSCVGDCWSTTSFSNTLPVLGAKERRVAVVLATAGAVPKDCTCTAKQQRKIDINRIILVIGVVNQRSL
jgi:hypothetical protein